MSECNGLDFLIFRICQTEDGEEEVEEEIEELGLPKSITSAGKESSSKPSPPTDAVEYDGKMAEEDAEEEKMLPAIAVAAISSGVEKKGSSSPGEKGRHHLMQYKGRHQLMQ